MDKATLDSILTTALASAPFTITGERLASPSIGALLSGFLNGTLAIDGAAKMPSAAGETVIAGALAGPFFGQNGLRAEAHFSVVDDNAEAVIYLTGLAPGWKPSASFPMLAGGFSDRLGYSDVKITLDSRDANGLPRGFQTSYGLPASSPALEARVARGMSFTGAVAIDAGGAGNWLLKALMIDPSFGVTCPIELAGGVPRLRMSIASKTPYAIAGFTFPISLDYIVSCLELPGDPPIGITDLIHLGAGIEKMIGGRKVSIPIAAQYSSASPAQIVFTSDLASASPITLAEIPSLIAGASIDGQIPSDLPALANITLTEISFTVGVGGSSLALTDISATVGYADPTTSWRPFGDLVRFHDMSVTFTHTVGAGGIATHLTARADIAKGTLAAEVWLPEKRFALELQKGSAIDLVSVLNGIVGNSVTMSKIECTKLKVSGDVPAGTYELTADVSSTWGISLGRGQLVLEGIGFDVTRDTKGDKTTGQMVGTFSMAGTELNVRADYADGGWTFKGGTVVDESIPLTALVNDAASLIGLSPLSKFPSITITNIDMMFESATRSFFLSCGSTIRMLERDLQISVLLSNVDDDGAPAIVFQGFITIGDAQFTIDLSSRDADTRITARWADAAHPLDFARLAEFFGLDISGVPTELVPQVTSASFTYDFTTKTLVCTATTQRTRALLVSTMPPAGSSRVSAALLGVDVSVSLSDLPIIGEKLAAVEDVGITGVQVMVCSAPLTKAQVVALNALVPSEPVGLATFPEQALDKGLMLSIPFQFGGTAQPPIAIRYGGSSKPRTLGAAPSVPDVAWLNVQRSFGPVNVKRIGVGYSGGRVTLAIDAGFALAALSVELQGLTLGFTLHAPRQITPALHGMAIGYDGGPLKISGGFLDVLRADGTHEYDGEALISAESFTISAIGSYATIDGAASLFIFAMLSAPLGGPAFFFVTGVAAGFGVNRSLTIPTLDELPRFPLVAAAMAGETGNNPFAGKESDPAAALAVMSDYIAPSYGANWLAIGVRFTSFEMIQSFALVTIAFGTSFEVSLLGLSAITIPTNAPNPIGFAELALSVTYSPEKGVLAVMGKLTPRSYIFDPACHLTGGFAFYTWLTDGNIDGAPAGEFVVTLGGYHPHFLPPPYYPKVPRIGANWQVTGNMTVKGSLYFALTPTCVMAGGSLEAVWQSGDLKAWFSMEADFLLSWKPFHYSASLGLSIGASYRLNLLFTSVTISVHLGVWLELWGPSFAGTARVDLSVVSFTISFGDSSPSVAPISWDDFKKSFLPNPNSDGRALRALPPQVASASDTPPIPTDSYCHIRVADGLVKDLTGDGSANGSVDWVINPEKFQLVTHSAIPCTAAALVTGNGDPQRPAQRSQVLNGAWTTDGFGVGPVGVADGKLVSRHVITVFKVDGDGSPDDAYDFSQHSTQTPTIGGAPRAAWSAGTALSPDFTAINNAPSVIPSTLSGFVIASKTPVPDRTLSIEMATLLATLAPVEPRFSWSAPSIPTTDPFDQKQATQMLMSTIGGGSTATTRSAIVSALAAQGLQLDSTIDVGRMAASAANVLIAPPVLSYLGEMRGKG